MLGISTVVLHVCLNNHRVTDATTKHIAQTNTAIASSKAPNVFLLERQSRSSASLSSANQPFTFQSSSLSRNDLTLDLLTKKYSSLESTSALEKPWAGVHRAASHTHNIDEKQTLKDLASVLERRPTDIGVLVTVIQLCALAGNTEAAASYLQKSLNALERSSQPSQKDSRFAPGLVALTVSLAMRQGRTAHIKAELAKACSYWRTKLKNGTNHVLPRTRAAAAFLDSVTPSDLTHASELYHELRGEHANDEAIDLGIISALPGDAAKTKH